MLESTFCEKISYHTVCKVFEQISAAKNRDLKVDIMQKFMVSFREQSNNYQNDSFYPILRLILPQLDRERGPYGIKEHTLAKTYIRILCLSNSSRDAQKLLNYRTWKTAVNGQGDFAETAYWILRSRFSDGETLTVYEVNQYLNNIANKHADKDPRGVDKELQAMILQMSPLEQKWLIRILLKDMHLGISHGKILQIFHPDANDYYDVTSDLQKLCSTLKDPSVKLNEIVVSVFKPFRPMLCQRCDVQQVETEIKKADAYYIEIKFDGERFQLHMQNDEFKHFSRNGNDFTNTFGSNSSNGILTPKLVKFINPSVKSCILDGEMMGWKKKEKCLVTKGKNFDVKSLKFTHEIQPCYCVFDILYVNGEILTNKPLLERFKIIEEIIQQEEGVLMISSKNIVKSRTEILNILNEAIYNCEEGIVVKDPVTVYKPNARNAGWYKIKPEYTEGCMTELDLLIIGGYYGKGRNRGVISQFLLAVADSKKNENNEPVCFYSVGRVGSGCSDEELKELNKKLEQSWKRVVRNQTPPGIEWSKDNPDVWIKPSESYILQVKAMEMVPNNFLKVGYTLRFPRIQVVRYDKPWHDCLTADEFINLRHAFSGKLTAGYIEKLKKAPSRRTVKRKKEILKVDEECQMKRVKNVNCISTLLKNHELCVLSGEDNFISKSELETKIIQYGGSVVQNPGAATFCIIANEKTVRVSNIIKLNKYNVVRPSWLLECIENNVLREWHPNHFLAMAPSTAEKLNKEFDSYGDSYTEPIYEGHLKKLMNSMKVDENVIIDVHEMIELDKELFSKKNPFAIFRGCFAYFSFPAEDETANRRAILYREMFKYHGGILQEKVNEQTTHIVIFGSYRSEVPPIDVENEAKLKRRHIVRDSWIVESWDAKILLEEAKYFWKIH